MNSRYRFMDRVAITTSVLIFGLMTTSVEAAPNESPDSVVIGKKFSMESKVLGEKRGYWVHTPELYDQRTTSYPILILLDGDAHFAHTAAAVDFLANNERIPEMIVVGVLNTDRGRDLTPPTSEGASPPGRGAADKFLAFIGDELVPEIDRQYRTRPYRVIVGHSLGGLFAVYALTERPTLFNAYLPISPSLWVEDQALVKKSEAFLIKNPELRVDLYMTMGNEGNAMLGGFWKLSALLEEKRPKNMRWQIKRSPDETHGSIPHRSTYDGLEVLFDGWRVPDPMALYEQGGLAGIDKHYATVSDRVGYPVLIPGHVYSGVLDALTTQKRTEEAEAILKRALQDYPKRPQTRVSLARIYLNNKDEDAARMELAKVVAMYPGFVQARTMLSSVNGKIPNDATLSAKAMQALVGEYLGPFDTAWITTTENKLTMSTPAGSCELRALSDNRLYCVNVDVEFTLHKDKSDRVTSMQVEYSDYQFMRTKVKTKGR